MKEVIVNMQGITKGFNGIPVLKGVNFDLYKGEVHALIGGNGAGKSTLMKIMEGVHQPEAGVITVAGKDVHMDSVHDARALGLAMIFQEFSLVSTLTVAQNVYLSRERKMLGGLIDDRWAVEKTRKLFEDLGVQIDPEELVSKLSTGQKQLTEIAKALSQDAKVLVMDEPTASLTRTETEALFLLVKKLKERGMGIVYISHRMEEIFAISDRITVLRDGHVVSTGDASALTMKELIDHIVGHKMEKLFHWVSRTVERTGRPLLEVRNLTTGPRVRDVSLSLYPGEILGVVGLMGSGRTELLQAIFGISQCQSGEIRLRGNALKLNSCRSAMDAGIALVPEDRRIQGLIVEHSIADNIMLPILKYLTRWGFVDQDKARIRCQELIKELQVKIHDIDQLVRQLSGGNQQKVVLAKWLARNPSVLLLDEPTAGIDIGSKTEIIFMIRKLAESEGKGIILVSSELPEVLAVCDRVLILKDGQNIASVERGTIENETMLHSLIQGE